MNFNPRSPRGERRYALASELEAETFQSTLPSRGATGYGKTQYPYQWISIHAPLAGSDSYYDDGDIRIVISIHAPLAGSDLNIHKFSDKYIHFNPRSPRGERHLRNTYIAGDILISIHAPLAGSDIGPYLFFLQNDNFNPRSPRGERQI
ncbi:hypothetical protein GCWU000341_00211 [Oribacterium sp. oral taxon 078 str. F0262]|nr:hypothetical protein GCWU000341_00211 [Oribacterium sp. oral taxon 078 str. F0262]